MDFPLFAIFALFIIALTISAWWPVTFGHKRPVGSWLPCIAITVSSCMQFLFIVCLYRNLVLLDSSMRFARIGAPFCLIALLLAVGSRSLRADGRGGRIIVSAFLGLTIWGFFLTAH
jgi:hypothetical protein